MPSYSYVLSLCGKERIKGVSHSSMDIKRIDTNETREREQHSQGRTEGIQKGANVRTGGEDTMVTKSEKRTRLCVKRRLVLPAYHGGIVLTLTHNTRRVTLCNISSAD